jgi:hypothetical protein
LRLRLGINEPVEQKNSCTRTNIGLNHKT